MKKEAQMGTQQKRAGRWLAVPAVLVLAGGMALARPDVLPVGGTVGTRISLISSGDFGNVKGKVNLVDATTGATTALKVVSWTSSEILADVSKPPAQGFIEYRVSYTVKGAHYVRMESTFTFAGLELDSVTPETANPSDTVTIQGSNFGAKAGKVSLGYPNPKKPGMLYRSCKVVNWTMTEITFLVPVLPPGEYTLHVDNKISSADWSNPFTIPPPI